MRVVSGPIGREKVHYEAPSAARVDGEMHAFLRWFNGADDMDLVLKACIAHVWFVTIHPFEDGNGRIARALADLLLARSERSEYYKRLETTQKGNLEITSWAKWFLDCLGRAFEGADAELADVFGKAQFWERYRTVSLNDRQRMMVNKLLDGFEGKLTSSKWAKIAKSSPDTALRDIDTLIAHGILKKDAAGGRSTSYSLADANATNT
jgi:Fic family protein